MAKWQRRVYRGLLAAIAGSVIATGWVVHQTTSSAAVRQQVISQLRQRFVGAEVALGSAQLRLVGGISFTNLTLYRRDDPSQTPFLHVPAGVIYHDKEQLGQGRLVIRKIKFERPRLTAIRSADGRWNLSGILGPVRPDVPIPVFEVVQGAVIIDCADAPSGGTSPLHLEIHDVNGALLNHPLALLNFDLRGAAKSFGPLTLRGSWHRSLEHLNAAVNLAPVSLGPVVLRELTRIAPAFGEPIEQLGGDARVFLDLQFRADATPAWRHTARVEVQNGRLVHRALPLPIEQLDMTVACRDGAVAVESLSANAGRARITAQAQLDLALTPDAPRRLAPLAGPSPGAEWLRSPYLALFRSLEIGVSQLSVTPELFDRLPAALAIHRQRFAPSGLMDLTARLERTADHWSAHVALNARDMSFRFEAFPYPLHGVRGQLQWRLAAREPPRLDVNLTARGNLERPVAIQGRVTGSGADCEYAYALSGDGLPIDEPLVLALPGRFQNVTRSFHPTGRCDITASIRRRAGESQPRQDYRVRFKDATVCYDVFPVPLDRVSGTLDIHLVPPDEPGGNRFEFADFRGERNGGRVTVSGTARPLQFGNQIDLTIRGERLPLDGTLGGAFGRMRLRPLWDMLSPSGQMDFDASLTHVESPHNPPEFTLRVAPRGAALRPSFFPLMLTDLSGAFTVMRTRVDLANVRARHGVSDLRIHGGSILFRDGGYWADLGGITAEPLPVDVDLVRALPRALQSVCRAVDPRGNLAVQFDRLVIDQPPQLPGPAGPPLFYWKGRLALTDASLRTGVEWDGINGSVACTGRYRGNGIEQIESHVSIDRANVFRQPLTGLHARAYVDHKTPHELRVENIQARLYDGTVGGEACVSFGSGLQYRIDLKAVGLQLEKFAKQNRLDSSRISGQARVETYLSGAGTGADELEGAATVHVPSGRLYNLPVFLDLLKVLGLHSPDGAAFEEAHAEIAIHGRRAEIQRIDLLGNSISLGGRGEMNLDGSDLQLDFYAVWGHIVQLLPAGLREIPPWLSKNLLKIAAKGQLGGKIDYAVEPVPSIVEPMRNLLERMQKRESTVQQPLPFTPRLKGN